MDKSVWKETIGENANKKDVGPHDRCEGRVHTEKGEGISIVEGRKRRGKKICEKAAKKGIYSTVKVTTNGTSVVVATTR